MKRLFVLGCTVIAGCVSSQPGSEKVVFTSNPAVVSGCRHLGQETVQQANWVGPMQMQKDAMTDLRNKAASKGGTHVLTSGPSPILGAAMMQTGDVYRC